MIFTNFKIFKTISLDNCKSPSEKEEARKEGLSRSFNSSPFQEYKRKNAKLEELKSMLMRIVVTTINFKTFQIFFLRICKRKFKQENFNMRENSL